tara:strand:- start:30530 stop:30742 length:213 start_codon:yes stop_codon:yes gene_type:complete
MKRVQSAKYKTFFVHSLLLFEWVEKVLTNDVRGIAQSFGDGVGVLWGLTLGTLLEHLRNIPLSCHSYQYR